MRNSNMKLFFVMITKIDLVYFTTRVLDTSDTSATQVRYMFNPSNTSATQVKHKCKILILITTQVKTYFHTHILAM